MDRYDLIVLCGILFLAAGVYLVYAPAALIVIGAGLILFGLAGARGGE